MPEDKTWTGKEIREYASQYNDNEKLAVVDDLLKDEILARFLNTSEHRVIIDSVVDEIALNIRLIIDLAIDGFDKNIEKIRQASFRISIARKFMFSIATIADRGKEHQKKREKMEKAGIL